MNVDRTWADEGLRKKASFGRLESSRVGKLFLVAGKTEGGNGAGRVDICGSEGTSGCIGKF